MEIFCINCSMDGCKTFTICDLPKVLDDVRELTIIHANTARLACQGIYLFSSGPPLEIWTRYLHV